MTLSPDAGSVVGSGCSDLRARTPGGSAFAMVDRLSAQGASAKQMRSWELGAEGEVLAAAALSRLPRGWFVLHDVPVGVHGANIDHVVFGPAGVFTVNTKHHKGRDVLVSGPDTLVSGRKYSYVEKALGEADRAATLLSKAAGAPVYVRSVLLFVGGRSLNVEGVPVVGLTVASDQDVCSLLTRMPDTLSALQVDELVSVASRAEVWALKHKGPGPQDLKAHSGRVKGGAGRVRTHPVASRRREPVAVADGRKVGKGAWWRRLVGALVGLLFVGAVGSGIFFKVGDAFRESFPDTPVPTVPGVGLTEGGFVGAVRDQFPALVNGVDDAALIKTADRLCALGAQEPVANRKARRVLGAVLDRPSRAQVAKVARIARRTNCPVGSVALR